MLEYILLEKEEIKLLSDKSLLRVENKEIPITTLITNQRMLLFDYPKDEESFRSGPQINPIVRMKKEIILETRLSEIEKIIETDKGSKYVLKNGNYFYLTDSKITSYVNSYLMNRENNGSIINSVGE